VEGAPAVTPATGAAAVTAGLADELDLEEEDLDLLEPELLFDEEEDEEDDLPLSRAELLP